MQTAIRWVTEHGYRALFFLLSLGVVGAPIPDETLLVVAGAMVARGQLHPAAAFAAAFAGSIVGITLSYGIGRFASRWLSAGQSGWRRRLAAGADRARGWFDVHGPIALTGGYFLPGVRHLISIAAGASGLPYRTFALYAYSGAFLWAATFLSIGWFAGEEWRRVAGMVDRHVRILRVILVTAALTYLLVRAGRASPMIRTRTERILRRLRESFRGW